MDLLHEHKMRGFYLDVARYTFNYLFDLGDQSVVVRCNLEEAKTLKEIFHIDNLEINTLKKEFFINIILKYDNFVFEEVEPQKSIMYEDLIIALYRNAKKEDNDIGLMTQKRLFKQSLDYGFKNINLK